MLLFVSVLSLSCVLFLTPQKVSAWDVDDQHQLIPMYIYPFWWVSGNDWYRVCESMNTSSIGSTAIMNPDNGAGSSHNTDYDYVIDKCHDEGHNVVGYVDTSYGAVPLATVKAHIDNYYNWYDTNANGIDARVDGVFIDQMSNFPNDTANTTDNITVGAYYREIYEYVKAKDSTQVFDAVIGNPGSPAPTDWQLNDVGSNPTKVADEVVVFEGPPTGTYGLSSYVAPAWVDDYPASDIAMLVYDVPSNDVQSVCQTLKNNNAGLVDVTNYGITSTSTPWNYLQSSTYWSTFTTHC